MKQPLYRDTAKNLHLLINELDVINDECDLTSSITTATAVDAPQNTPAPSAVNVIHLQDVAENPPFILAKTPDTLNDTRNPDSPLITPAHIDQQLAPSANRIASRKTLKSTASTWSH